MIAAELDSWARVFDPDCALVIEERATSLPAQDIVALLADAPFTRRAEGDVEAVLAQLDGQPAALLTDITQLVHRFMTLMQCDAVRVRVEGVTTNACKKLHADYTDLRLITTYAGPGTDYAPHGDGDCCLERVPAGAVALFKGRTFHPDHAPCFHRSPPIEGTDQRRLVLVIDTPLQTHD
jgi:hypothetical protein